MLGIIVIMQVFAVSEGLKRTTTNTADAQENGLYSLTVIERDARMAGYGLGIQGGLRCTSVKTYDSTKSSSNVTTQSLQPVTITDGGAGADQVEITYSASGFIGSAASVVKPMPNPSAVFSVDAAVGINPGDLVFVVNPGAGEPCSQVQVTKIQPTGHWIDVDHNKSSQYNPPNPNSTTPPLFPAGGFGIGAKIVSVGSVVDHVYAVNASNNLQLQDLSTTCTANCTLEIANNIVNIQAQYGITAAAGNQNITQWVNATSPWDAASLAATPANVVRIKAVRIAIVARSTLREHDPVTTSPMTIWPADTSGITSVANSMVLTADQQHYRYKTYITVIPLRNILWTNS